MRRLLAPWHAGKRFLDRNGVEVGLVLIVLGGFWAVHESRVVAKLSRSNAHLITVLSTGLANQVPNRVNNVKLWCGGLKSIVAAIKENDRQSLAKSEAAAKIVNKALSGAHTGLTPADVVFGTSYVSFLLDIERSSPATLNINPIKLPHFNCKKIEEKTAESAVEGVTGPTGATSVTGSTGVATVNR